jgi:hypothetical protein
LNRYDKRLSNEKPNTKQNYTNSAKTWQTPTPNNKPSKPQTSNGALMNGTALPNRHNTLASRKPDRDTSTYSNNNRKPQPPTATSTTDSAKWSSGLKNSLENRHAWPNPPKAHR